MKKTRAYLLIVFAAILWGGIGYFYSSLRAAGFSAMQVVAIRVVIAAVLLASVVLLTKPGLFRIRLRDVWCFAGTGVISLLFFNWCYFSAISRMSLSVAAVLLYTSPVFVMLFSVVLFGEKLNIQKVAALTLTVAGCALVSGVTAGFGAINLTGILLGLGAGIGYALYSIFGRCALQRGYDPVTISLYTFIFASVGAIPLSGIFGSLELFGGGPASSLSTIGGALGIGVLCCIFPYLLYTKGLAGVENSKAAIIAALEPVVAAVIGVTVLHEMLTLPKIAGMLLILSSIFLLNLQTGQKGPGHNTSDL